MFVGDAENDTNISMIGLNAVIGSIQKEKKNE